VFICGVTLLESQGTANQVFSRELELAARLPVTCRKIASDDVKRQTRFPSIDKNRVRHEIWTVVSCSLDEARGVENADVGTPNEW
jgi:hypothetical protein